MKHNTQDFAQAEFARHTDGRKAMRREDVSTDQPWFYLEGNAHHRRSDQEMADEGWVPVQAVSEDIPVFTVRGPYDLFRFRDCYGMRSDWHEPDEQGVGARVIGTHLDNAMGSTTRHEHADWGGEFNIVLTHEGEDRAVVNLATLLSWAAQYGEVQR